MSVKEKSRQYFRPDRKQYRLLKNRFNIIDFPMFFSLLANLSCSVLDYYILTRVRIPTASPTVFASYLENDMTRLSLALSAFPHRKILEELLEDAAWTPG